jgi:large subunit ribosomal protein L30e
VSLVDLEKQLKAVTKSGKYVVGRKEVLNGLKGSKLVVWSASANVPPRILDECKNSQVPAIRFDGNPIELGRTCGIPYKVSVIAVKSPGDAVLSPFQNSEDYSNVKTGIPLQAAARVSAIKSLGKEAKQEPAQNQKSRATKSSEDRKSRSRKQAKDKEEEGKEKTKRISKKAKKKDQEKQEPTEGEAEVDTNDKEE